MAAVPRRLTCSVLLPGKNSLGLGPNATGLALGILFFGVYYGSSFLTRKWVMQNTANPEPPKYFRDIRVTQDAEAR